MYAGPAGCLDDLGGPTGHGREDGVEEAPMLDGDAALVESGGEHDGVAMGAMRDVTQSFGPVVDRVHRGDDRQQHLRRTDVRRSPIAPDVLLPSLQREPV